MPLLWPDPYQRIKDTLYSKWEIKGKIEILREFSEGKSTARVFEVDLHGRNHRGLAILKLDTPHHWSDADRKEAERYAQAAKSAPEYAQKHLPRLLDACEHEGQTALLCSVAGDALNYTEPFHRLDKGQQIAAVQRIARGILEEWNKDYEVSDPARPPYVALASWLGYRIHPELGGRVHNFLESECGLDPTDMAFSFLGQWFPNPCVYAAKRKAWSLEHEIKLVKGRSHGDLHGHNVLVKLEGPYDYTYYLIDLALYEEDSYLFYDHVYLELSHLLHYRGNAGFSRWLQILRALVGIHPLDIDTERIEPDDAGLLSVLHAARQEVRQWIQRHESARQEHIEGQVILARVAVGLNFVNKEIDDRQRQLAFLYAAMQPPTSSNTSLRSGYNGNRKGPF